MPLQKEIIDNSDKNKLVNFLNNTLKENAKGNFDIATAFFNITAFAMIKANPPSEYVTFFCDIKGVSTFTYIIFS